MLAPYLSHIKFTSKNETDRNLVYVSEQGLSHRHTKAGDKCISLYKQLNVTKTKEVMKCQMSLDSWRKPVHKYTSSFLS